MDDRDNESRDFCSIACDSCRKGQNNVVAALFKYVADKKHKEMVHVCGGAILQIEKSDHHSKGVIPGSLESDLLIG